MIDNSQGGLNMQFEIAVVRALARLDGRDATDEMTAEEAYDLGWGLLRNRAEELTAFQRERLLTAVAELERDRNAEEILAEMHYSLVKHVAEQVVPEKMTTETVIF